jgi:hypothetical protein
LSPDTCARSVSSGCRIHLKSGGHGNYQISNGAANWVIEITNKVVSIYLVGDSDIVEEPWDWLGCVRVEEQCWSETSQEGK